MKKFFPAFAIFISMAMANVHAQDGQTGQGNFDPAVRKAKYFERIKPLLIEKTKLTGEQAQKVLEISFENRSKMRDFRNMSGEERKKAMDDIQSAQDKAFKEILLTEEQIKAVNEFFEEQRKQRQQRMKDGGGNGGS